MPAFLKIASENELLDCFRPLDREEVELPENLRFPLAIRDYLTWTESSGYRVFLVMNDQQAASPLGIAFRRDQKSGGVAMMCEWCHAVRSGNEVALLTATASNRHRVGLSLCRDLSCKERLKEAPGPSDLPEGMMSPQERMRRILRRMATFARQNLF